MFCFIFYLIEYFHDISVSYPSSCKFFSSVLIALLRTFASSLSDSHLVISRFPRFFSVFSFFLNNFLRGFSDGFLEKLKVFLQAFFVLGFLWNTLQFDFVQVLLPLLFLWDFFENFAECFFFCAWVFFCPPVDNEFCAEIQVLEQG